MSRVEIKTRENGPIGFQAAERAVREADAS
jgi:hypothetical protein